MAGSFVAWLEGIGNIKRPFAGRCLLLADNAAVYDPLLADLGTP
ncbi:hypothetical protein [Ectothiorhodospira lacustris]|nr:hypothetical protein [Ectothiorhodospira lacustris]